MDTTARASAGSPGPKLSLALAVLGLGCLPLYVPTAQDLLTGIWASDQQGHGPLVLAIALWLIYRRWRDIDAMPSLPAVGWGWGVFGLGMFAYVLGRTQGIQMLEVGSFILVLCAALLLARGLAALKLVWFAIFFMLFMVPLPGVVVDTVTQPMKTAVSNVAEFVLYHLGYPIARSGVILQIGPYQLLVADACAGLNTLLTLEALGLLYLNLVRHDSALRNIALAILIVPISFAANVIRVIVLSLITFHFGDDAGQGFLHGFAGMVLFLVALALIVSADSLTRVFVRTRTAESSA